MSTLVNRLTLGTANIEWNRSEHYSLVWNKQFQLNSKLNRTTTMTSNLWSPANANKREGCSCMGKGSSSFPGILDDGLWLLHISTFQRDSVSYLCTKGNENSLTIAVFMFKDVILQPQNIPWLKSSARQTQLPVLSYVLWSTEDIICHVKSCTKLLILQWLQNSWGRITGMVLCEFK